MAEILNFFQGVFRGYFHMCLTASLVILAVLVLRLLLKNIPKNLMCVLWLAVLFRLLCPVTVAGPLPGLWASVRPEGGMDAQPRSAAADNRELDGKSVADMAEGLPAGSNGIDGQNAGGYNSDGGGGEGYGSGGSESYGSSGGESSGSNGYGGDNYGKAGHDADRYGAAAAARAWFAALAAKEWVIFLCGVAALAGSIFFLSRNALRFHRAAKEIRRAEAVSPCTSQRIWGRTMAILECEGKNSPMVFGLIRPRICLPPGFAEQVSVREYDLILKHEGAHIRRGDCLLKYLSWIALSIHWWNPLARISVKLLQKDMEMACDEYVMAHSGENMRKEYATVLLRFSMANSGMTFPVAFGESNTEKRVSNVLKYRKRPVIYTLSILGIVGALTVCLVTDPHNREAERDGIDGAGIADDENAGGGNAGDKNAGDENAGDENARDESAGGENAGDKNAGGENTGDKNAGKDHAGDSGTDRETENREDAVNDDPVTSEDVKAVFSSMEEALAYYQERWQEKLTVGNGSADGGQIVVRQSPWPLSDLEADDGKSRRTQLCYYVLDRFTGIPTSYITCLTYEEREGKIYVNDSEDEAFEHVTTAEQAQRMKWVPFGVSAGMSEDVQGEKDSSYMELIIEKAMLSSGNWQFELRLPETSIPLLLHLEGGVGEFQRAIDDQTGVIGYVTYTFGDGSVICYGVDSRKAVSNDRDDSFMAVYFPTNIMPESRVEAARQAEAYLGSATTRDFRNALPVDVDGYWDLPVKPELLDMMQDRDVALYGLSGNDIMVLRDGEQLYPVYRGWWTPHGILPRICMGDYDGDGEDEYAIITHTGTGTGVSVDDLYILEKTLSEEPPEELSIHEFDHHMQAEQFSRVSIDWDSEQQTMHIRVDGELTGLSVSLGEWLASIDEDLTFQDLVFGDYISFTEENGQLYLRAEGGILLEEWGWGGIQYEKSVTLTAPVIYSEGTFSLGEIKLTEGND